MGIDLAAIRQENIRLESQGQNNFLDNFVPMPDGEGTIVLRLLPPQSAVSKLPFVLTRTHKLNGKSHHCPMQLSNGKWLGNCPICNYYRQLWKDSETASESVAKAKQTEARGIKPVERYYWNAIVRSLTNKLSGETEKNVGPKIFSCGKQLQAKIIRAMCGAPEVDEPELGDITDPQTGRDLKIIKRMVKSGAEAYPNYNESKFLAESVAGTKDEIVKWLGTLHDLQSLRNIKPFDELKHELDVHRGLAEDKSTSFPVGGDSDDEAPAAAPAAAPARQAPTPPPTVRQQANVRPAARPAPVAPSALDDADEGFPDEAFFEKLKSL